MPQRSWDLAAVPVDLAALPAEQVVQGAPAAGDAELLALAGWTIGVWEITPGVVTDVEVDELAVVLSGRGSVLVDGERIALHAGVLLRLRAGDRTVWTIEEPLRKLYLLPGAAPSAAG